MSNVGTVSETWIGESVAKAQNLSVLEAPVPRQAGVTLTRDGTDGTVPEADSLQSLNKRGVAHDGTRGSAPSTVCHVRQTVPSPSRVRCIAR